MIRSTNRYVLVLESQGDKKGHARMLHKDTNGRECVRYDRSWWTVRKVSSLSRVRYVLDRKM